jgi:hypothetical protein
LILGLNLDSQWRLTDTIGLNLPVPPSPPLPILANWLPNHVKKMSAAFKVQWSEKGRNHFIKKKKKKKNEDCNNSLHSFSVKIAADAPLALLVPLNIFRRGFLHFVLRMLELTNVSPYLGSSWCDGHNSHSFFSFVTFFCFCFRLAFSTSCRIETRQAIPSVES